MSEMFTLNHAYIRTSLKAIPLFQMDIISGGEYYLTITAAEFIYMRILYISDDLVSAAAGTTSFDGVSYTTVAENLTGLLAPGSTGVNHGLFFQLLITCSRHLIYVSRRHRDRWYDQAPHGHYCLNPPLDPGILGPTRNLFRLTVSVTIIMIIHVALYLYLFCN